MSRIDAKVARSLAKTLADVERYLIAATTYRTTELRPRTLDDVKAEIKLVSAALVAHADACEAEAQPFKRLELGSALRLIAELSRRAVEAEGGAEVRALALCIRALRAATRDQA